MATIFARNLVNGNVTWRVQFRRKGVPYFHKAFTSEKEAKKYADENERAFIKDPDKYIAEQNNLEDIREREFERRGIL